MTFNKSHSIINRMTPKGLKNVYPLFGYFFLLFMILPLILSCGSDTMEVAEVLENPPFSESGRENNTANNGSYASITEFLIDNGHTELLEAVTYVNAEIYTQLGELFADPSRQHTLFAPNNEAFFKLYTCLGMKTLDISELDDPGFVRDILLYHMVRGVQDSSSIIPNENENTIETLAGINLTVKSDRSVHSIGSIAFIGPNDADKRANNGIVHVINEVLLPTELSCQETESP